MRIRNTHKVFSTELIREIINFVRPPDITDFDVWIKNSRRGFAGKAYCYGCSYHDRMCPYILVRVGTYKYPMVHRYRGMKTSPAITLMDWHDTLVYLIAHELRHLWQAKAKNKRGYYRGSKGRFSEIDTVSYGKSMLIKWRASKGLSYVEVDDCPNPEIYGTIPVQEPEQIIWSPELEVTLVSANEKI